MAGIVFLTTVHPRNDTRIFFKEARSLAGRFPGEVLLMVADGHGHDAGESGTVAVRDLGSLEGGRIRRALLGPRRAWSAIRRINPVVVHFHDPELIPLGIALKLSGCRVIYDVHEDVPRQILSKDWLPALIRRPVAAAMGAVEFSAARVFDAVVAATPSIAKRFPAAKTVTIQNYPILRELEAAVPVPYAERPLHFVYPGVIAAIRGAEEMIRAVHLLGDLAGVKLELAGGINPSDYASTLRALPGWESVVYHGEVARAGVARMLGTARAGLVVHHPVPNEVEAQPIKLYEYMSEGLPVIASDFPLLREIVEGCGCGLLVDPMDPRAIANAMRWILDHPLEAERMGERGREAVERSCSWDQEAAKLVELYLKVYAK